MQKCPIQICGRVFESAIVLREHLKRRHPTYQPSEKSNSTQQTQKPRIEELMQQQVNKLPKLKNLKQMSKQRKNLEFHRKSSSKSKKQLALSIMNSSKVSTIICQSRQMAQNSYQSKPQQRPSLTRRGSAQILDHKDEKLPELKQTKNKKMELLKNQISKPSSQQQQTKKDLFYTTAPNFKKIELRKHISLKQRSGTSSQKQRENASNSISHRISTQQAQNITQEAICETKNQQSNGQNKHKSLKRFLEKAKNNDNEKQLQELNFDEKIIVISSVSKLLIPPSSKLETLIANNCTLHQLSLSNAPLLQTLSLQHNQLKNVDFLNHPNNHQLQKVHIDHNQITSLPQLPPNLKIITASFNLLDDIESVALDIKNCKQLQEIDFTFNPIRKISSYKVQILSSLLHLKKIDGIKVTKIDLQMAIQYLQYRDQLQDLIPTSKNADQISLSSKDRPSTAVSQNFEVQVPRKSEDQLMKQINKLQKIINQTQQHYDIIKQQNEIIQQQIEQFPREQSIESDPTALYQKLIKECEALQLLQFLQYADEEEIESMIAKKQAITA